MTANKQPIFSAESNIGWDSSVTPLKTANTAKDGTGTVQVLFTAGANGARVERVRALAAGTNVATVLRIFINNGGTNTVALNNTLYANKTIPATTNSETAALLMNELPDTLDSTCFPLILKPNERLLATIGTTIVAGLYITAVGSNY